MEGHFSNNSHSLMNSIDTDYNFNNKFLNTVVPGSCGAAIISRNCVVRQFGDAGSAVRTVEEGALIVVWSCHDDVRFSIIIERTLKPEPQALICKSKDIIQVPHSLLGALFPVPINCRAALLKNAGAAERLSNIVEGSAVNLVGPNDEHLGSGTVLLKAFGIGPKDGYYYGVKITGQEDTCAEISQIINVPGIKSLPEGCNAVVTIQRLRPAGREYTGMLNYKPDNVTVEQAHIPKSISHHSIKSYDEPVNRRQASRSLDLSSKICRSPTKLEDELNIRTTNWKTLHLKPQASVSRSLDLPSDHKLTRERASTSMDNDTPPRRNELETLGHVEERNDDNLDVGSLVELMIGSQPCYGVIRWMGRSRENPSCLTVGVEMDEELEADYVDTKGLFTCPPYKGIFVPLARCRKDSRFQDDGRRKQSSAQTAFGQIDCPVVEGNIPPISEELENFCGKNRGIQGHHNSCYLDATLFSMFAFTSVFDSLLYRPATKMDIPRYADVQKVLREEIVNPLRRNLYVRADRVMKLRTLLEELSSVTGLTSEEKDPEEFLNSLVAQILRAEPFLHLSSGQEAFHYQLFVEKDEKLTLPSVQNLLEQSFLASNIKLKKLPPCLIVQMPRFGKAFKMYSRILPSMKLDVTNVIENSPRECDVCGGLAELECKDCYLAGLEGGCFCRPCLERVHSHSSRSRHSARALAVPIEFRELQEHCAVPKLYMHLFAVVCIETSHYVAFLNTDQGWVFFDSMADRKGEQNGYNIPEIVPCPDLPFWFSEAGARALKEMRDERQLPELAKRLLCDAYMCMYQSPDIMMYR